MEVQQDTIYIQGLPTTVTVADIESHFSQIGLIKKDKRTKEAKIWLYTDKATGQPKGDATVTYEDAYTADAAIDWFSGKPFGKEGGIITVTKSERKASQWSQGDGGGGGRGGYGGGRGGGGGGYGDRDGGYGGGRGGRGGGRGGGGQFGEDWPCPSCGNTNFARRAECNRCKAPKPSGLGGGSSGGGGGYGGDRGGSRDGGYGGGRGGGYGGGRDRDDRGGRGGYGDRDRGGYGGGDRDRDGGRGGYGDRDRGGDRDKGGYGGPPPVHLRVGMVGRAGIKDPPAVPPQAPVVDIRGMVVEGTLTEGMKGGTGVIGLIRCLGGVGPVVFSCVCQVAG